MVGEEKQNNRGKYMMKKFVMGLALVCDGGAGAGRWGTGIGEGEVAGRFRVPATQK
jgi:hypothetical protein